MAIDLRVATALTEIVVGTIAQLIIGAALGRWLIGSVARQVIACAHCAVTVVRA